MTTALLNPSVLAPPEADDRDLVEQLGTKGYPDDAPLSQFAAWAEHTGLTDFLYQAGEADADAIVDATELTHPGLEAIGGVLVCLGLLEREGQRWRLSTLAREFLAPASPFYQGASLYLNCRRRLPNAFVKPGSGLAEASSAWPYRAWARWRKRWRGWDWGGERILENQHSRNLPAGVAAAQLPRFEGVQRVVDMAGGTGTFSIPLAQRLPGAEILLTDLPQALDGARSYLARHGLEQRIKLRGMDLFADDWGLAGRDLLFFGNFVHGFDDDRCADLARRSLDSLAPGGMLVWHELTWNEQRDGPLKAALFHVTMQTIGGRQRTVTELHALLQAAGFERLFCDPTKGGFQAVGGYAPNPGH